MFCALPPLGKFFTSIIFMVAAALLMLYLVKIMHCVVEKLLIEQFRAKTTRTKIPVLAIILEGQCQVWVYT
jgi:hypothetical protein